MDPDPDPTAKGQEEGNKTQDPPETRLTPDADRWLLAAAGWPLAGWWLAEH